MDQYIKRKLIFIISLTLFFSTIFLHELKIIINIININIKIIKKKIERGRKEFRNNR